VSSQVVIHRAPARLGRASRVLLALVVLAGIGGVGWYARHSGAAPAVCTTDTAVNVKVSVSPDLAPSVTSIADQWVATKPRTSDQCIRVTVTDDGDTLPKVSGPGQAGVAMWIPDSSAWISDARGQDQSIFDGPTLSVASSPIVFAVSASNKHAAANAAPILTNKKLDLIKLGDAINAQCASGKPGGLSFALDDPDKDAAGFAAATWLRTQINNDVCFMEVYRAAPHVADRSALIALLAKGVDAVPLPEQAITSYDAANPSAPLAAIAPAQTPRALDYPAAILSGLPVATATATQMFRDALTSPAYAGVFAANGFRLPQGGGATGFSPAPGLDPNASGARAVDGGGNLDEMIGLWRAATLPARVLALVDTGPSMAKTDGGTLTRMQVLTAQAGGGLRLFDSDDQLGIWAFGGDASANKLGYTPVAPPKALSPAQQAMLGGIFQNTIPSGRDNCGFYPAMLAAYQDMTTHYDPTRANTLIVFTDTTDLCGKAFATIESQLQALADPTRPIVVILLTLGADVDAHALSLLANDMTAKVYQITPKTDIAEVFMSSLLAIAKAQ
jgi:Ca-activated chloride channel family protein